MSGDFVPEPVTPQTGPTAVQVSAARRKLRKFLLQTPDGFGDPIVGLRGDDGESITMQLHWESEDGENWRVAGLDRPSLDKRLLDSVIVECRVLFTETEDCYLPGIVKALQLLSPQRARALDPLKQHVAQLVRGGRLAVAPGSHAVMYSGRLEMDNGLGEGLLLGSDQIAMDYIYGVALHQDEDRRRRLENVSSQDTIFEAVILTLNDLLHISANVRRQVMHDVEVGHIVLDES
ncbi:hypothetical protein BH09ACT2_BH09ACT2_08340 [soil metagenome]